MHRLVCCFLLVSSFPALATADVVISEIRLDQPGHDRLEYFELRGPAGTPLQGLTYLVLGDDLGACGSVESVVPLDGLRIPAGGFLLVAETATLSPAHMVPLNFENNDNVTHLLVKGFTGHLGQDLDLDNDGELDLAPWSGVLDAIAISEGTVASCTSDEHTYGDTVVGPDGHFAPGHVFLCEGRWEIGDFDFGVDDSPGRPNGCSDDTGARSRR